MQQQQQQKQPHEEEQEQLNLPLWRRCRLPLLLLEGQRYAAPQVGAARQRSAAGQW